MRKRSTFQRITLVSRSSSESHGQPERRPADLDSSLIRRTLQGDESAIEVLVARLRCVPAILASINDKLGAHLSRDELADLSQDTLVRIWGKISTYQARSRLETWVYGFCLMEVLNRVRSRSRGSRILGERIELVEDPSVPALPAAALEAEELERELRSLAAPESDVIRLKHFDGLTFKEIGAALGIPENSAKTHYYRGLSHLRTRLRRLQHEDRR